MKHAVLTDSEGNILGVLAYNNVEELRKKTFEVIQSVVGDEIKTHIGKITTNSIFSVQYQNEPSDEFYLTPTEIV